MTYVIGQAYGWTLRGWGICLSTSFRYLVKVQLVMLLKGVLVACWVIVLVVAIGLGASSSQVCVCVPTDDHHHVLGSCSL